MVEARVAEVVREEEAMVAEGKAAVGNAEASPVESKVAVEGRWAAAVRRGQRQSLGLPRALPWCSPLLCREKP